MFLSFEKSLICKRLSRLFFLIHFPLFSSSRHRLMISTFLYFHLILYIIHTLCEPPWDLNETIRKRKNHFWWGKSPSALENFFLFNFCSSLLHSSCSYRHEWNESFLFTWKSILKTIIAMEIYFHHMKNKFQLRQLSAAWAVESDFPQNWRVFVHCGRRGFTRYGISKVLKKGYICVIWVLQNFHVNQTSLSIRKNFRLVMRVRERFDD